MTHKDIKPATMWELEANYRKFCTEDKTGLDLSCWIPAFGVHMRPLYPGEFMCIVADTGVGKTAIMQSIAVAAGPMKTLMFELELPDTLCFERFMAMLHNIPQKDIEKGVSDGARVDIHGATHIDVVSQSGLTIGDMEDIVNQDDYELVIVDYIGLVKGGGGSRYERVSDTAEDLKALALSTNTVMLASSQIHRKGDNYATEVSIHDAKDSGAIEASAGVVIGVWRDEDDSGLLKMRINKNTKGAPGAIIEARFDGPTLSITPNTSVVDELCKEFI